MISLAVIIKVTSEKSSQELSLGIAGHTPGHLSQLNDYSQRRQWHPSPILLPGKSHGQRSLVGYSHGGQKESDMTERLMDGGYW